MELGLQNKVAIVCASSKGIGKGCAMELAREGCKLAMCARNSSELKAATDEIGKISRSEIFAETCDVTDKEKSQKFVKKVMQKFGTVHILVNNCGGPPPGKMADFKAEDYMVGIERSLLAPIYWTYLVVEAMKAQKWGRIINITSLSVKEPIENIIQSNTARAGLTGFARSIATELAPYGILVNNVLPGKILTDRLKETTAGRAAKTGKSIEEALLDTAKEIPLGRLGTPEEFGALVAFLCSMRASYVTGCSIQVDGGLFHGLL
jgi:3-oxoacyl-[acyl-carrier protein] reductase